MYIHLASPLATKSAVCLQVERYLDGVPVDEAALVLRRIWWPQTTAVCENYKWIAYYGLSLPAPQPGHMRAGAGGV